MNAPPANRCDCKLQLAGPIARDPAKVRRGGAICAVIGRYRAVLLALLCLIAFDSPAHSQSETSAAGARLRSEAAAASPTISPAADPQIFKLREDDGRLIYVPDLSFDEWQEFLKYKRNLLPVDPPAFTFAGPLQISGRIEDSHAQLDVTCRIRINPGPNEAASAVSRWTRVPLRFNRAFLAPPGFEHAAAGDIAWTLDEQGEGHIVWIHGAAGSEHELRWRVKVPVMRQGALRSILLDAPSASTVFEVSAAGSDLQWSLSEPQHYFIGTTTVADGTTRIRVEGVGGPLRLSWRDARAMPVLLQAKGRTSVRLIGTQVVTQATLAVRSFRQPVQKFFVRLPPGAEWIPPVQPELSIEVVEEEQARELGGGQIVRIGRADGSPQTEFEVQLETIRTLGVNDVERTAIQTSGFEVIDADQQSGEVDFVVEGEWTVDWEIGPSVRRVLASGETDIAARFLYNRQPYSIVAEIRKRESRIRVEPTYILDVSPNRIKLDASLVYRVSGARANELKVDLSGWDVDTVSPPNFVAATKLEDGQLAIQLTADPAVLAGEIQIDLEAYREYDAAEPLSVPLPKPQAESSSPAVVAVISADNVRLSPNTDLTVGLIGDAAHPEISLPARQQRALTYRADVGSEVAAFAANVELLEQDVTVSLHSEVLLDSQQITVEQQLTYRIDYEPLTQLYFDVPAEVAESGELEVTEGDIELTTSLLNPEEIEARGVRSSLSPRFRRFAADLREPRIGPLSIELRYRLQVEQELLAGDSELLLVELAQPVDGSARVEENTLQLHASPEFEAQMADGNWELVTEPSPRYAASGKPFYRVPGPVEGFTAAVEFAEQQRQSTTKLDKVWVQVWQSDGNRRDRVCYQLRADEGFIDFMVPGNINEPEIAVNGQPQAIVWEGGLLRVELPPHETSDYTIEIWYWLTEDRQLWGSLRTSIPRLVGVERASRLFWQLVVPENQHLMWPSTSLTSESVWRRRDFYWRRVPNLEQSDLEKLLGASTQAALPPRTNRYLFSSTGPFRTVAFVTADRSLFIMAISATSLAAGLLFLYFSWLRHPAVVLFAGLSLAAVSAAFAEAALLVSQAAVLGFALLIVARLLQWTIAIRPLPPTSTSSARGLGSHTKTYLPPAAESSNAPTAVSPLPIHVSTAEPEP